MTDKTTYPEVIEHIGIKLWRANQDWKERFTTAMVDRGFHWYAEARGSLFQYMGPNGIAQIQLAEKAKISKQAVQQHLDDLEADGVIERVADPNDARKKHIKLTNQGVEAVRVANEIKIPRLSVDRKRGDYLNSCKRQHLQIAPSAIRYVRKPIFS
jgi:DNA-binding MarR family transcriptional regulator